MTEITLKAEAVDKKSGMTLAELAQFVMDAQRAEIPGSSLVRVATGFAFQIQRLQVPR